MWIANTFLYMIHTCMYIFFVPIVIGLLHVHLYKVLMVLLHASYKTRLSLDLKWFPVMIWICNKAEHQKETVLFVETEF